MAAIVIGDISYLSSSLIKNNHCGVSDALESLYSLYIVCYG